jgi:hypothetical protein
MTLVYHMTSEYIVIIKWIFHKTLMLFNYKTAKSMHSSLFYQDSVQLKGFPYKISCLKLHLSRLIHAIMQPKCQNVDVLMEICLQRKNNSELITLYAKLKCQNSFKHKKYKNFVWCHQNRIKTLGWINWQFC